MDEKKSRHQWAGLFLSDLRPPSSRLHRGRGGLSCSHRRRGRWLHHLGDVRNSVRLLWTLHLLLREVRDFVFSFHIISVRGERCASCQRGDSNPHGLLHWILSPARLPIPPLRRSRSKIATHSNCIKAFCRVATPKGKAPANCAGALPRAVRARLYLLT
jgi:hypothetical protein